MRTPDEVLETVREMALSRILWPLLGIGGVVAFVLSVQRILSGDYLLVLFYLTLYGGLVFTVASHRTPFNFRAMLLLGLLVALGVTEIHRFGLVSLAGPAFLGSVFFAGVLLGQRTGLALLGFAIATNTLYGWLYVSGTLAAVPGTQHASLDGNDWFVVTMGIAFIGLGALLSSTMIIRHVTELAVENTATLADRDAEIIRRVATETKLRDREARYDSFMQGTTDAVWCYEFIPPIPINLSAIEQVGQIEYGLLVECNPVCARVYSADTPEQVLGKRFRELLDTECPAVLALLERFIDGGYHLSSYELIIPSVSRGQRHFVNTMNGVLEDGMLIRMWGSFQEVTDIRQVTQQREAAEDRFSTLVRNIPGAVYRLQSLKGSLRLLFISEGFENIAGMSANQAMRMRGKEIVELTHPDDRARVAATLEAAAARRESYIFEYRLQFPNGETRWVLNRGLARAMPEEDGYYLEGVIIDVSARREAEARLRQQDEQLRQAQKMEAIGQLAGGIAHDFNNILQGILGFSDIGLQNENLPPRLADSFRHINRSAERAAALVRQLLMFSRRMEAQPEYIDLAGQVARTSELLRRILGEQISLQVEVPAEPQCVYCDGSQMEQLVINLAVNARDAMPQGGTLSILVEPLHVTDMRAATLGLPRGGDYVRLEVRDTGEGMDDATLAHIFEPFFTTKPLGKGTGLGLATVYGIVQRYAGWIEARSERGFGATFDILLPRSAMPSSVSEEDVAPTPVAAYPSATILLAEDDDVVRAATRQVLENAGYHVIAVCNGREGLTAYEAAPDTIDIAILDVVMPEMGGVELLEVLRARNIKLPVLLLTGYADIPPSGMGIAPIAVLQKPMRSRDLLNKLHLLLEPTRVA